MTVLKCLFVWLGWYFRDMKMRDSLVFGCKISHENRWSVLQPCSRSSFPSSIIIFAFCAQSELWKWRETPPVKTEAREIDIEKETQKYEIFCPFHESRKKVSGFEVRVWKFFGCFREGNCNLESLQENFLWAWNVLIRKRRFERATCSSTGFPDNWERKKQIWQFKWIELNFEYYSELKKIFLLLNWQPWLDLSRPGIMMRTGNSLLCVFKEIESYKLPSSSSVPKTKTFPKIIFLSHLGNQIFVFYTCKKVFPESRFLIFTGFTNAVFACLARWDSFSLHLRQKSLNMQLPGKQKEQKFSSFISASTWKNLGRKAIKNASFSPLSKNWQEKSGEKNLCPKTFPLPREWKRILDWLC